MKQTTFAVVALLGLALSTDPAASQDYDILLHFGPPTTHGTTPRGGVLEASDGKLYGTTRRGGADNSGVVYSINRDGSGYTVLHQFSTSASGNFPRGGLLLGNDGLLYGTTELGGTNNAGIAYRIDRTGNGFQVIRHFGGSAILPSYPLGGLLQLGDGRIYGTTYGGGDSRNRAGTVYRMQPDGSSFEPLAAFGNDEFDGFNPNGPLIQASDGRLYGILKHEGLYSNTGGQGAIYSVPTNQAGVLVFHHFGQTTNSPNLPSGRLFEGTDGNIYGTAEKIGANFSGVLYRVGKNGSGFTVLHSFTNGSDGDRPVVGVVQRPDGKLYGVADQHGTGTQGQFGTLYSIQNNGNGFLVHHAWHTPGSYGPDGSNPQGELTVLSDGSLIGVTDSGGSNGSGVIWIIAASQAAPQITSHPASVNAVAGTNVLLSVTATGSNPLHFQWQLSNTNLPGANAATLALNNLTPAQDGYYRVIITNTAGAATSQVAEVNVIIPPLPTTNTPPTITTNLGGDITLTVTPDGTPPFTYQWRKNGTNIVGALDERIAINNTVIYDGGLYDVIVSGPGGSVTNVIALLTFTELHMYAGLNIGGPVGKNYRVDYTEDLSGNPTWTALTNFALPSSPYLFIDRQSRERPKRFYRAVPID